MSAANLVDPACVQDTFCEGIGNITKVGDNFRLTIFATRDLGDGLTEQIVVAREIWPAATLKGALYQIERALNGQPFVDDLSYAGERPAQLS
jgi:hypothetical protein